MNRINTLFANPRLATIIKITGAVLVLTGLLVGGAAAEPVIMPN